MTPTLVHRYAFTIREAIETLLGDAAGDCEAWRIRIEGVEVVIDVVAPAPGIAPTVADLTSLTSNETAKSCAASPSATDDAGAASVTEGSTRLPGASAMPPARGSEPQEPQLRGGPLARRAAIACGERGFWTFLGVASGDEAKTDVCRRCGITTRKMLDHDERAAAIWQDIDGKYRLWLDGHDVDLD